MRKNLSVILLLAGVLGALTAGRFRAGAGGALAAGQAAAPGGIAQPAERSPGSTRPSSGAAACCEAAAADDPDSGAELIGQPAPAWTFERWLRTPPLSLEKLRGKVVLLRWWTEDCHFCRSTLPALERVQAEHSADGFVVIGVFHPKPPREVSDRHVLAVANELGFSGPIAVDTFWPTLDRYWLDGNPERNWTSVSFLIDRNGRIRWVHGGGEYHPTTDPRHARCDLQYREFEQVLAEVLGERQSAATTR